MKYMTYKPRFIESKLKQALDSFPVVSLEGARASGKTTTARTLAKSVIELPKDLDALKVNPERTLAGLEPPVLIDEWQLAGTDLLWTIKGIVDRDPAPGRFLLTGSVEPATYGETYPLTGRALTLTMRPMTVRELKGEANRETLLGSLLNGKTPEPTAGKPTTFQTEDLFRTGFPAASDLPDPAMFLEAYAATVAQRSGDEGRDATRFLRTLQVLATLSAQAVPDQRIWDAADINKATWKSYQDLMARTYMSADLPAFTSNRLKRLTEYPKRFLADTALALALSGLTPAGLDADPTTLGRYLESYAVAQLRTPVDLLGGRLCHLRTDAAGREVDIIADFPGGIVAIEVKAAARPEPIDAKHLRWLRDSIGERFLAGLVVHTGGDVRELDERIWAVPVTLL